jgi:integrase
LSIDNNEGRKRRSTGGIAKYRANGRAWWKVNVWLKQPDGSLVQFRQRKIPTREQAELLVAKRKADAFEGRYFDKPKAVTLTVAELWGDYEPITKRDNDSWQSDTGRAVHLLRHLGDRRVMTFTLGEVDAYRTKRLAETTRRKKAPSPQTLDHEVGLLKRIFNYAVKCGRVPSNPIAGVALLRVPNVRRSIIGEAGFQLLLNAAEAWLRPILLVAFDTGMRKREVLDLRWEQVKLKDGVIELAPQDTKAEDARTVMLTARVREALRALPHGLPGTAVFPNPATGKPWNDIRKGFRRACAAAGIEGFWYHDQRRSFVTKARKADVPESVVMRMSGHRTRKVFERYNIVNTDDLRAAVARIEAATAAENGQEVGKVASGDVATDDAPTS